MKSVHWKSTIFGPPKLRSPKCLDFALGLMYTPLKFNMEPEHGPLEKEIPFWKTSFSGSMLNFGGVYFDLLFLFCNWQMRKKVPGILGLGKLYETWGVILKICVRRVQHLYRYRFFNFDIF